MTTLTPHPPIATAHRELPGTGMAARRLAHAYLRFVSALWRGDPEAAAFEAWLDGWWCQALPTAPAGPPDARSPHGGGGRGIRWYEAAGEVRGYVPGTAGGYRVPRAALVRIDALLRRQLGPDGGSNGVAEDESQRQLSRGFAGPCEPSRTSRGGRPNGTAWAGPRGQGRDVTDPTGLSPPRVTDGSAPSGLGGR